MTSQLAPIITAVPFIGIDSAGRGIRPHPNFIKWWAAEVDKRVGGQSAPTNTELQQQITTNDDEITALENATASLQSLGDAMPPPVSVTIPDADEPAGMADLRARLYTLEKLVAQLREGPP